MRETRGSCLSVHLTFYHENVVVGYGLTEEKKKVELPGMGVPSEIWDTNYWEVESMGIIECAG